MNCNSLDNILIELILSGDSDENVQQLTKLLDNGMSPNYAFAIDYAESKKTLLEYCCRFSLINYIQILIDYGVELEIFTEEKETPLHLLAYHFGDSDEHIAISVYERVLDKIKHLINFQDSEGKTALMLAVKSGTLLISELLIKYHANVNIIDIFGNNCLHCALMDNNPISTQIKLINLLINSHADAHQINKLGMTPIDYYLALHPPLQETPFFKILK